MANLAPFLLSTDDLLSFETPTHLYSLSPAVYAKLANAKELLRSSYIIDKSLYDEVFITSDIHADLIKFDFLLMNAGLITKVATEETVGLPDNIRLISDSVWTAERTLLIIVGDLVDGMREMHQVEQSVPDPKGNIELLLHAYLYNLRIQARAKGSEIRFTIGNHDYHTVIKQSSTDYPNFYKKYVHKEAITFFGLRTLRRDCLLPFYECCPYLLLSISDEIVFIHGGFTVRSTKAFLDSTTFCTKAQQNIDLSGSFSALTDLENLLLSRISVNTSAYGFEGSPLWSRRYAHGPKAEVCGTIDAKYKMVVVGHCQTGADCCITGQHTAAILAEAMYTKYNCRSDGGCVLIGCQNETGPHLAFVDIAMSRVFNPYKPFVSRAEFLHLIHNPNLITDRHYNVIIRKNIGGDGSDDEVVWSAPAHTVGGRLRKTGKKSKSVVRTKRSITKYRK